MEPFAGSIEIVRGNVSTGFKGGYLTPETVPALVEPIAGITGLTVVEPSERALRVPVARWIAMDADGFQVEVLLWRRVPEDMNGPWPEEG